MNVYNYGRSLVAVVGKAGVLLGHAALGQVDSAVETIDGLFCEFLG